MTPLIAYGSQHPTAPHLCGTCFYDKRDCVCLIRRCTYETKGDKR